MNKKERDKLIRETEKALTARREALRDEVENRIKEEEVKVLADLAEALGMTGKKDPNGIKVFSRLEFRGVGIRAIFARPTSKGLPSKMGEDYLYLSYLK